MRSLPEEQWDTLVEDCRSQAEESSAERLEVILNWVLRVGLGEFPDPPEATSPRLAELTARVGSLGVGEALALIDYLKLPVELSVRLGAGSRKLLELSTEPAGLAA